METFIELTEVNKTQETSAASEVNRLQNRIKGILTQYISDAENYKKSRFKIANYFTTPYGNEAIANTLLTLCNDTTQRSKENFINELCENCATITCSSHFLPNIVLAILESGLYPNAEKKYNDIKEEIDVANSHNDGGGYLDFETRHWHWILTAANNPPSTLKDDGVSTCNL